MPGLYGYVKKYKDEACLRQMTAGMLMYDHYVKDRDFECNEVAGSRIHLGTIGMDSSPLISDDLVLWIEGECYNLEEMNHRFGFSHAFFAEGIAASYRENRLDDFLSRLDGYFCAVIYDKIKKKILLISDRYGMRMLYLYCKNGRFAWCSEVKGLLRLDWVDKIVNKASLSCFLDLGYLLEENTWFEDIKLIKPASVVEFDLGASKLTQRHYWEWSKVKQQNIQFDGAVEAVGHLLKNAVKRRLGISKKIGISLSGGLDSRAIFAAIMQVDPGRIGYAYTFGLHECLDVELAKMVVGSSGWEHEVYELSENNWFDPRIDGVWRTDGMFNLMHMHGSEFLESIKPHMDINLNGYAGDAVLGGSFLGRVPLNKGIDENIASIFYKGHSHLVDNGSAFYDIPHAEPAIYMNRVRRFTNMGTVNVLSTLDQRKPFFDNELLEFVFSIDDSYRFRNKLYAAVLLKYFPDFFNHIPWQKTGKTIDKKLTLIDRIVRRGHHYAVRFGLLKDLNGYTNYRDWIKSPSVACKLKELLSPANSFYSLFMNVDLSAKYLEPHLKQRGIDYSERILAAATMEIYFRRAL